MNGERINVYVGSSCVGRVLRAANNEWLAMSDTSTRGMLFAGEGVAVSWVREEVYCHNNVGGCRGTNPYEVYALHGVPYELPEPLPAEQERSLADLRGDMPSKTEAERDTAVARAVGEEETLPENRDLLLFRIAKILDREELPAWIRDSRHDKIVDGLKKYGTRIIRADALVDAARIAMDPRGSLQIDDPRRYFSRNDIAEWLLAEAARIRTEAL